MDTFSETVNKVLINLGIPTKLSGYKYLETALEIINESPDVLQAVTSKLYPETAKRCDTSPVAAERNMRTAIKHAWMRGSPVAIRSVFGESGLSRQPTVSEFLSTLTRLINAMQSENYSTALTANEYQRAALRTASPECHSLGNVGLGLSGEAGECTDLIKKHLYHGHELDKESLKKELGDVLWYVAVGADVIGCTLEDIMKTNIDKLMRRYPEGFDKNRSINRID